jgi:hypothetical protein
VWFCNGYPHSIWRNRGHNLLAGHHFWWHQYSNNFIFTKRYNIQYPNVLF